MRAGPGPTRSPRPPRGERGVGLMEVVIATIIAVIAVVALAYSFGAGRGLVNQYEVARIALAAAQRRMETLSALPATATELQIGVPHGGDVQVDGRTVARESWTVAPYTDPASGHAAGTADLKQVTVTVTWGRSGPNETVALTRLFPVH
jgi:hypothetical protein